MCFPQQREAYFWKIVNRKMSWSIKKNMKNWCSNLDVWCKLAPIATKFYKNVGVMHAVVFADRAQEAKSAQLMGPFAKFEWAQEAKK